MPERLDLKLEPPCRRLSPQETGTIKLAGRYLYGPPAADLAIEGEIVVKPSPRAMCRASPATSSARPTSSRARCASRSKALPATDADGKADIAVHAAARCRKTSRPLEADVILKLREVRRPHHRAHRHAARRPEGSRASASSRCSRAARLEEGETARFEVDRARRRRQAPSTPRASSGSCIRLDSRWQWYSRDGSWNYEAADQHAPHRRPARVDAAAGAPAKIEAKRRLGPLSPRGQLGRRIGPSSPARSSTPAGTPTKPPTAPRCSTSPSTSQPTRRARPPASRSPRAWRPGAHRRAELGPAAHAGGRPAGRRRRGADPRRRRLGPRRLRHRHALPADGREGQAHAEPRARPALARRRPGAAHAQRRASSRRRRSSPAPR